MNVLQKWLAKLAGVESLAMQSVASPLPVAAAGFGEIIVTDQANDPPAFRRDYHARLVNGFSVTVKMETSMFGERRERYSQVTQANGRWVLFDVRRVADKIIDRELLPMVQAASREILAMDAAFVANEPRQFRDSRGVTWQRVNYIETPSR